MDELRMLELLRECVAVSRGVLGFRFPLFREELDALYDIIEKKRRELLDAEWKKRSSEGKK